MEERDFEERISRVTLRFHESSLNQQYEGRTAVSFTFIVVTQILYFSLGWVKAWYAYRTQGENFASVVGTPCLLTAQLLVEGYIHWTGKGRLLRGMSIVAGNTAVMLLVANADTLNDLDVHAPVVYTCYGYG